MKTLNLIRALGKVGVCTYSFDVRCVFENGRRSVEVVDQGGRAVGLPMIDGRVVHNGKNTIKNLVTFLAGK